MANDRQHIETEELIQHYFIGKLSAKDQEKLLALVQTDNEAKKLFARYTQLKQHTGQKDADYSGAYADFLQKTKTLNRTKTLYWTIASIAAATIIFLAHPIFVDSPNRTQITVATHDTIETINLPDNSTLIANVGTELHYQQNFEKNRTVSFQKGEAHFEIAKDSLHPFTVQTPEATVTVLGTGFNVKIDSIRNTTTVCVLHGKVSVKTQGSDSVIVLTKKQKLIFDANSNRIETKTNNNNELSWENSRLQFESTPIKDVVSALNNHFGSNIFLKDTVLNSCRLNANFEDPQLNDILEMMRIAFSVEVTKTKSEIIISGPGC